MSATFELVTAAQLETLHHLMQLYLYDFTEFLDIQLEEDGRFRPYPDLQKYVQEPAGKHRSYLFRSMGHIAGFALVDVDQLTPDGEHYLAEFFVLKRYRRQGIGREAAFALFDLHPGRWSVSQLVNNIPAQSFWRQVIDEYTGGSYSERVKPHNGNLVQLFCSNRAVAQSELTDSSD